MAFGVVPNSIDRPLYLLCFEHVDNLGAVTITQPTLSHSVTDAAIQKILQQQIKSNASVPRPDANTLYFIYLPPGTAVVQGGPRSCQAFCGYHDTFGNGHLLRGDALSELRSVSGRDD